jgi:hypothetical protein
VGFDVKVTEADEKCLFTVFENKESKYKRWADEYGLKLPEFKDVHNAVRNLNYMDVANAATKTFPDMVAKFRKMKI